MADIWICEKKDEFSTRNTLRLYIDSKLVLNDYFSYEINNALFYNHDYFYTVIIKSDIKDIAFINEKKLKPIQAI